jgi:integrase
VKAKLPKLTFHGQRHEAGSLMIEAGEESLMIEAGEESLIISRILGHSSVAITSDVYGHMIGSASKRAVENGAAPVPPKKVDALAVRSQPE